MYAILALIPLVLATPIRSPPRSPIRRSAIPLSDNTIPFTSRIPVTREQQLSRLAKLEKAGFQAAASTNKSSTTVLLNGVGGASGYALNVTIGNQTIEVIADTGSSDLWFPVDNFQCEDMNGNPVPLADCSFGPNFLDIPSSYISNLSFANNFNITYGSGTVYGFGSLATVTVGNISVKNQEFGVGVGGYWPGDNVTNGLLGLANPLLTDIYYGTNSTNDSLANEAEYNPWFYQAVNESLVEPYFSLVLNRSTLAVENTTNATVGLGSITFGGIPTNVPITNTTVTVPNIAFTAPLDGRNVTQTEWYTTTVDSFNFPGSNTLNTTTPFVILDSGTTLIYVPDKIAAAYALKWSPPGIYNSEESAYLVNCTAKAPYFSVTIGGKIFTTTPDDVVYPSTFHPGLCVSSVYPGGSDRNGGPFILGDRFLVNVIPTFNIQTSEITITQRQNYTVTS